MSNYLNCVQPQTGVYIRDRDWKLITCAIDSGIFNARDPRKRESHLSIDQKRGGFCTLNTSLECHKVTNYPFSILIRAAHR